MYLHRNQNTCSYPRSFVHSFDLMLGALHLTFPKVPFRCRSLDYVMHFIFLHSPRLSGREKCWIVHLLLDVFHRELLSRSEENLRSLTRQERILDFCRRTNRLTVFSSIRVFLYGIVAVLRLFFAIRKFHIDRNAVVYRTNTFYFKKCVTMIFRGYALL